MIYLRKEAIDEINNQCSCIQQSHLRLLQGYYAGRHQAYAYAHEIVAARGCRLVRLENMSLNASQAQTGRKGRQRVVDCLIWLTSTNSMSTR